MNRLLILLAVVCLSGCSHKARVFTAPDHAQLGASTAKLSKAVTESRTLAVKVSSGLKTATEAHKREVGIVTMLQPQLTELFRVAPPELRPYIEKIQADVDALKAEQGNTAFLLADLKTDQGALTGKLEVANAAKNEVEKYGPEYVALVDKQTEQLNESERKWAKDSKALLWYRLHWFAGWIVLVLGVLSCGFLAFLKATGRLAIAARP